MANDEPGLDVQIGLTTQRLAKQLADVEARMIRTAQRGEKAFATSNGRVAQSFNQVNAASTKMSGAVAARFQNVGYQVQDIAVQIAGGQGVVRALSQQLPQLAGGFGLVGVAIGTLAAVAIPLFASFGLGSDQTKQLEDDLKALSEAMSAFKAASQAATASPGELLGDFGEGVEQAQKVLEIQRQIAAAQAQNALAKAGSSLANVFGDVDNLDLTLTKIAEVKAAIAAASADPAQLQVFDFETAARQLEFYETVLTSLLSDIADQIGVELAGAEGSIQGVALALQELAAAETPDAYAAAMERVRDAIIEAAGNGGELNEETLELLQNLTDSEIAALGLAAVDIAGPIGAGADEAGRLAGNLALAAAQAALYNAAHSYGEVGARGDPRKFVSTPGVSEFKYRGPSLDADNNPIIKGGKGGGGKGGGASDADKEAKAFEKIFEQGQREIEQLQQRLDLIGKSAEETARLTAEYELLNAAKQAGLDLDTVSAQTGLTLRQQIEQQAAAIGALTEKYNLAKQQADFFNSIQEELQDGFIDAIVSGQDFAGVLANVAQQLAKAFLQAALFGKGPLAGLFGGSAGKGLFSFLGFAEGGFTGKGTKYQPAGIVHKGEYVFDAKATRRIGVRKLEALRSGLKGYANGGLVGGSSRSPSVNVNARPQVTVAMIDSEDKFGEFLAKNPAAEQGVMAIVRRNPRR
jgi:hypothetical protein